MPRARTKTVLTSIAANVRRLRERQGLTQEQLAEAADIDMRYLQRVERGTVNLSVGVLAAIAEALEVAPGRLFRTATLATPKVGRPRKKRGR